MVHEVLLFLMYVESMLGFDQHSSVLQQPTAVSVAPKERSSGYKKLHWGASW